MNEAQKEQLDACSDEINAVVLAAANKYDVRLVLAALGAQLGLVSQTAIAAGIEQRYILEIAIGSLECSLAPAPKAPTVFYIDGEQNLGRKQ